MSAQAHKLGIEDQPITSIISRTGAMGAAASDNLSNLKRVNTVRGDNTSRSTEKSNTGIKDKVYPISGYTTYSQCVEGMISDLSIDRSRAENECSTHFGGAETSSDVGKKTANRKSYPTMKTSKTIQVHNANRRDVLMDSMTIGQGARAKDGIVEGVPYWIVASGGDTSHLRHSSSSHIKSARDQGDDLLFNYQIAKQITHRDDVGGSIYDPELESMLHKKGELLATKAEIHRLKSGKVEKKDPFDGKPYWAYLAGY